MADANNNQGSGFTLLKDPTLYLALLIASGAIICFWIARAPTNYTGNLPLIGGNLPFKLTAVYFIVFGPTAIMLATAALWFELTRLDGTVLTPQERQRKRGNGAMLAFLLVLIFIFSSLLSLQYFLILAPSELCPSRPHFEFLWMNLNGITRINHCMSGTESINAEAPYYLEPQVVQAWGHVIVPILTAFFLYKTWSTWRSKLAEP